MDSGSQVLDSGFFVSGAWILDSSFGYADTFCCSLDNFKARDYGFHEKNFLESRLRKQNFSEFPYMG